MFNCPDKFWRLGVWALITCLEKFKLPNDLSGGAKFCPYTNFVTHLYGSAKVFGDRSTLFICPGAENPFNSLDAGVETLRLQGGTTGKNDHCLLGLLLHQFI